LFNCINILNMKVFFSITLLLITHVTFSQTKLKNGILKYDVLYDEAQRKENEVINLLPEEMIFYFNDSTTMIDLTTLMGIFRLSYITNKYK